MRMWMVDPRILCQQHLSGEHVEIHMFIGSMNRGGCKPGQYVGLLETRNLKSRHDALVEEMLSRGWMGHKTDLDDHWWSDWLSKYNSAEWKPIIDGEHVSIEV